MSITRIDAVKADLDYLTANGWEVRNDLLYIGDDPRGFSRHDALYYQHSYDATRIASTNKT